MENGIAACTEFVPAVYIVTLFDGIRISSGGIITSAQICFRGEPRAREDNAGGTGRSSSQSDKYL